MSTLSKFRKLTISSSFRKRLWQKPILSPKLTISGEWMKNAGFEIGDKVTVSVSNNLLIIQKAPE